MNKFYKIGDVFDNRMGGEHCALFQVGRSTVQMLNLKTFNRYAKPVKVKDIFHISEKEFEKISGGCPFTLLYESQAEGYYNLK